MEKIKNTTRAGKDGKLICCPNCHRETRVYHFAWVSAICQVCGKEVAKTDWLESPAAILGRKGGQASTPAKTEAARKNAAKPRGKWATAIAYDYRSTTGETRSGAILYVGKPPSGDDKFWAWAEKQIAADIGNHAHPIAEIGHFATRSQLI